MTPVVPGRGTQEIADLAPRRITWDLKRDIQDKLDKLETETQAAIQSLLRMSCMPTCLSPGALFLSLSLSQRRTDRKSVV